MSKIISFISRLGRDKRQGLVSNWAIRAFGPVSRQMRVERILEEAIELAQAEGYPLDRIAPLAAKIYAKPAGEPAQEVGGIGIALLGYCGVARISADECEARETARVLSKPIEHFQRRQQDKIDAGIISADFVRAA